MSWGQWRNYYTPVEGPNLRVFPAVFIKCCFVTIIIWVLTSSSHSILRAEEESMFQEAELSESDNGDALYESADELLIGKSNL